MLIAVHPKLPMRDIAITKAFYLEKLGFSELGSSDFPEYFMVKKDQIELHFFLFKELNPLENYGQVYIRVKGIEELYKHFQEQNISIHPNAPNQTLGTKGVFYPRPRH
jgi:catechol 2,3-dioxygenase-like lactoylglutathione lyase family enzyme